MAMKKNILRVSETFYSIQGEGQTMGAPAVFLRLGGCNLLCQSKSWICDTIEVWQKSKATMFEFVLSIEYVKALQNGAHLVITGGEPLLHQQDIIDYLEWFEITFSFLPTIEIETNGTIEPNERFLNFVDYWNVSPKLSSAGEQNKESIRINKSALYTLSYNGKSTIFKFVVSDDKDIKEIMDKFINVQAEFFRKPLIQRKQLVLMPAGSSQEELEKTRLFVAEQCRTLNARYSDRLHVVIWNLKTGV